MTYDAYNGSRRWKLQPENITPNTEFTKQHLKSHKSFQEHARRLGLRFRGWRLRMTTNPKCQCLYIGLKPQNLGFCAHTGAASRPNSWSCRCLTTWLVSPLKTCTTMYQKLLFSNLKYINLINNSYMEIGVPFFHVLDYLFYNNHIFFMMHCALQFVFL